ncbi:hypothetical protein ACH5RR_012582 [Cinchona calisaya]|uniref:Uncharacterized protein n=1 Tax=Cinchona calisaya TaxID=153742 RepID=A0ABD3A820_9GENT
MKNEPGKASERKKKGLGIGRRNREERRRKMMGLGYRKKGKEERRRKMDRQKRGRTGVKGKEEEKGDQCVYDQDHGTKSEQVLILWAAMRVQSDMRRQANLIKAKRRNVPTISAIDDETDGTLGKGFLISISP